MACTHFALVYHQSQFANAGITYLNAITKKTIEYVFWDAQPSDLLQVNFKSILDELVTIGNYFGVDVVIKTAP